MRNLIESILVTGIIHDKKTGSCIFEFYQDGIKWINVHTENIQGKFYQGCTAKMDRYNDGLLEIAILETDNKEKNKNNF